MRRIATAALLAAFIAVAAGAVVQGSVRAQCPPSDPACPQPPKSSDSGDKVKRPTNTPLPTLTPTPTDTPTSSPTPVPTLTPVVSLVLPIGAAGESDSPGAKPPNPNKSPTPDNNPLSPYGWVLLVGLLFGGGIWLIARRSNLGGPALGDSGLPAIQHRGDSTLPYLEHGGGTENATLRPGSTENVTLRPGQTENVTLRPGSTDNVTITLPNSGPGGKLTK